MESFLKKIYEKKGLYRALGIADNVIVVIFIIAALYLAVLSLFAGWLTLLSVLLTLAVPFVITTLIRRAISAARPIELYGFYDKDAHRRPRPAFPSRHALSAALISTLYFAFCLPLAIALSVLTIILSLLRVLRGYHFPRDVIAGVLIGGFGSLFGILILL